MRLLSCCDYRSLPISFTSLEPPGTILHYDFLHTYILIGILSVMTTINLTSVISSYVSGSPPEITTQFT